MRERKLVSARRRCGFSAVLSLAPRPGSAHLVPAMRGYPSSDDQRPLTYWNGYPVYATTLFIAIHVCAFLVCALIIATGAPGLLMRLMFSSSDVLGSGAIWQFITYAFIHLPEDGIWFAIEMLMLFWFGREVEQYLGRTALLRLYCGLLLLLPLLLTVVGFFTPTLYAGSRELHFAIFIGFAALYPGAVMMFGITAKWAAFILTALSVIQSLAYHSWPSLITLASSIGAVLLFIEYQRGRFALPSVAMFSRKPKFSVVRDPVGRSSPRSRREEDAHECAGDTVGAIDPLLDKIAKSGLASLTAPEREQLEKARETLIKRGPTAP